MSSCGWSLPLTIYTLVELRPAGRTAGSTSLAISPHVTPAGQLRVTLSISEAKYIDLASLAISVGLQKQLLNTMNRIDGSAVRLPGSWRIDNRGLPGLPTLCSTVSNFPPPAAST